MNFTSIFIAFFASVLVSFNSFATLKTLPDLPSLRLDPNTVTVSGVSAGGIMALQIGVAASDKIAGMGVLAGSIYGCSQGNVFTARALCMKSPENISVDYSLNLAAKYARAGRVPPLSNMKQQRIYIYQGLEDTVISPKSSVKIFEFASKLIPQNQIMTELTLKAAHGYPTTSFGNSCGVEAGPWMNRCGYDAAGTMLSFLYPGKIRNQKARLSQNQLFAFPQSNYEYSRSDLSDVGHVYIPATCEKTPGCKLHVALHGCLQNPETVGDAFIAHTGLNEWAETNRMVVLYPAVSSNILVGNPNNCWDWWGYSGGNFLTRTAPQIQSVLKMIKVLTK